MVHEISDGYIKVETHAGVTTIEFFHPRSNALPIKCLQDLAQEIHSAGTNDATKVIVLRSAGDKAFCAGADFNELVAIQTPGDGETFFRAFADVINAMRKCSRFIIGRVHGNCVGGGVGLAASVDYCIALDHVQVKLSELSNGFGPFVVGPAIERKIGNSAFSQLAIDTTVWRNADWAKRKGLFAETHSETQAMDESIDRLVNHLAHSNTQAMAEMKKMFWRGTEDWDELLIERAAITGRLAISEFTKNAITAFKNRPKK